MRAILYFVHLLLVAGILWSGSTRAETLKYSTVGPWAISIDPTLGHGCFVFAHFPEGTSLRMGFDMDSPPDRTFYVLLGNAKWRSIEYGKSYRIQVQFGDRPVRRTRSTGFSWDPPKNQTWLQVLANRRVGIDVLFEFMRERVVTVDYNGREILRLGLKGSYRAGSELIECQKAANDEKQDPFKDASSSRRDDPFR